MGKCVLRLVCVLVILLVAVPFVASIGSEHTYSIPFAADRVRLKMPDGEEITVSTEEFFIGTAAAFLPDETNEEVLRAFCVMLNTPCLTESGVLYLSPDERSDLFGADCDKKCELYASVWNSMSGESLSLPDGTYLSLSEYAALLELCEGSYSDMLASLFPDGGLYCS